MKIKLAQLMFILLRGVLELLYFFLKLFPVNSKKILFCSRQYNKEPLDFVLLRKKIGEADDGIVFVTICGYTGGGLRGYAVFAVKLLRSMYHLATSNLCIIDSYWPAVSMLKHKPGLKVIQIWHSIGKMKKSGYQTAGRKSGRRAEYTDILKMHGNYDYVIAGAPIWNDFYCEAFGITADKLRNYGLPRIDYLLETEANNRERFFRENPHLVGKKIVLYAPTFRKNMRSYWYKILNTVKYDDMALIVKNHPGQQAEECSELSNAFFFDNWETVDLIAVCDYMITDYSSIALEAAVLDRKTFYWTYDYDEYMENSGVNIDLKQEVGANLEEDIERIMLRIERDDFDWETQRRYKQKYLPSELGQSTQKIAELALTVIEKSDRAGDRT